MQSPRANDVATEGSPVSPRLPQGRAWKSITSIGVALLLLSLVEGLSSIILFSEEVFEGKDIDVAEIVHTRYDRELGWTNIENRRVKDMYGPGKDLRINAQGFRNDGEFGKDVAPGKVRVVCSGDSFTFGYGVGNENTWCHVLTKCDSRFETINMGQGGYGIDQAYLWYMRDGRRFEHNLHLFAFNAYDLYRIAEDSFQGYGKPRLEADGEGLVVRNVPVPKIPGMLRLSEKTKNGVGRLRLVQLVRKHFRGKPSIYPPGRIEQIVLNVFSSLEAVNIGKGSALLLVYLPTWEDYNGGANDQMRAWLAGACKRRRLHFIDLTDEFRKIPSPAIHAMFIPGDALPSYANAAGHYSEEGNRFVAEALYGHLTAGGDHSGRPTDPAPPAGRRK